MAHIPTENVTSYSDFDHKDYWHAIEWLKSQGLNVNNSRYVSIMRDLGEFSVGEYSSELIWGMSEVDTLYRVYLDILRHGYFDSESLRKLLNGSKFLNDEKLGGSENSRNYLFELIIAGVFAKSGAKIDFNTIADFGFKLPRESTGYVECKRIASHAQLKKRIIEAYEQIQLRCAENDVGIVGIDFSRLMWEHFNGKLVCSKLQDIEPFLKTAFNKITENINSMYESNNTIMIIGYYCVPFINFDDSNILFYRGMEIDLKYHERHLHPPFNQIFMHRAGLALWIKEHIRLSLGN
ncbi:MULTISPECIES: hypothetical protein [Pantoea]|uniref:hypothetical protein n=1 Tax=Pantoea TaxID=53335 RepID=UPI000D7187B3|nr:hypothetical protein [Pantoea ananatis]PWV89965.1 hypothetical protein C7426_103302 [Pantoea ananatis]REC90191.1 hypothetical protein C7423_1074 [Pantoea ananatis]HCN01748.1 hypothetical protein [Pantoea ananatis]